MIASTRLTVLFIVSSLIGGCASTNWAKLEESRFADPEETFTVNVPVGWMRAPVRDGVTVTRDGIGLQFIKVAKHEHKTAFPRIKKESKADMLPNELAELIIAEIKSNEQMSGLEVISNQPTGIGQTVGVRLHVQMKNRDGLRYQMVMYALVDKHGFYEISYRAPVLYYFQRDLSIFEQTAQSFRLTGKKKG